MSLSQQGANVRSIRKYVSLSRGQSDLFSPGATGAVAPYVSSWEPGRFALIYDLPKDWTFLTLHQLNLLLSVDPVAACSRTIYSKYCDISAIQFVFP
jgi:hypothetical protein